MQSLEVFTQEQLDEALARDGVIPVCAGDGDFTVGGGQVVRAADSAHVRAAGAAKVQAGGTATVTATEHAAVMAHERASATLSGAASASVTGQTIVRAREDARVRAGGFAIVEAWDAVRVTARANANVTVRDDCHVWAGDAVRASAFGAARAWVSGFVALQAYEDARVTAWGAALVRARGTAVVEAHETALVAAAGPVKVTAFGAVMVRARGDADVEAGRGVTVSHQGGRVAAANADVTELRRPENAGDWCDYYGVDVEDGVAILFKAVDDAFESDHGMSYRPGTRPQAADWDGGARECGGGLHFSPRPALAQQHAPHATRYVGCPVRLADVAMHRQALHTDKVKAKGVCGPVYEVDADGTPLGP